MVKSASLLLGASLLLLTTVGISPAFAQKKAWWNAGQPRFAKTDLGRVFSGSIDIRQSRRKPTLKPLAIRVGALPPDEGANATFVFDTELLRASAAIPDRGVMFNTYRDGLGGAGHWIGPPYLFTTRREPGWAKDGKFDDPRQKSNGPLPRDWAKYRGMYRHGARAVLAYTVGKANILESPWIETDGSVNAVTRTLEVGSSDVPLLLKVCDEEQRKGEVKASDGRSLLVMTDGDQATAIGLVATNAAIRLVTRPDGRVVVEVPARDEPARIKLLLWSGSASDTATFASLLRGSPAAEDLRPLTKPGPPQWTASIVTEGKLGTGDGPYVVDTLTAPYENPYRAQMTFGGHDFFNNGDAAICTIHGDVWRVTGIDDKLAKLTWHRYATGLFQPLGLKIVDDKVYVLGRDQITRLHDNNGDHQADYYENFNNDCKIGTHVHEYTVCLETDPEGNFYYVKGTNGGQSEHDGTMIRVSKDGSKFEIVATGFRWPNGAGAGPDGTVTVADQQGNWVPSSRIDVIRKDGFYGYMPTHHRAQKPETFDGPLCWIPHSVDNSCGGQTWVTSDRWGPVRGHMLHLSYGKCTLFLVLQESVGDVLQGAVTPIGVKFLSGAMRGRFRENDGQLYVCGLRGWQTSAGKDGCFQRVRYTGKPLDMPVGLKVHKNGLRLTFAEPLDKQLAADYDNWSIEQWNYRWTKTYGSKDYLVSNPQKQGHDELEIDDVHVSQDGKSVFLEVADLQPVMQMKIQYDIAAATGQKLRSAVYNTIHRLGPEWKP